MLFANLIEYENYNNEMDNITKLSEKNRNIILEITEGLLYMQ